MTDRIYALSVVLEVNVRDDDLEPVLEAIKMIRGVLDVEPHVADVETWAAYARARHDLGRKLWRALPPMEATQ